MLLYGGCTVKGSGDALTLRGALCTSDVWSLTAHFTSLDAPAQCPYAAVRPGVSALAGQTSPPGLLDEVFLANHLHSTAIVGGTALAMESVTAASALVHPVSPGMAVSWKPIARPTAPRTDSVPMGRATATSDGKARIVLWSKSARACAQTKESADTALASAIRALVVRIAPRPSRALVIALGVGSACKGPATASPNLPALLVKRYSSVHPIVRSMACAARVCVHVSQDGQVWIVPRHSVVPTTAPAMEYVPTVVAIATLVI